METWLGSLQPKFEFHALNKGVQKRTKTCNFPVNHNGYADLCRKMVHQTLKFQSHNKSCRKSTLKCYVPMYLHNNSTDKTHYLVHTKKHQNKHMDMESHITDLFLGQFL